MSCRVQRKDTDTKHLLQRRKGGLVCAVARRDILYFESFAQGRNNPLSVRVARHYEVKAAGDQVDSWVDCAGCFDDPVNAGMRTAHHDHHAVRRIDGERELAQFQRSRFVGHQCDQMDVGGNLGVLPRTGTDTVR